MLQALTQHLNKGPLLTLAPRVLLALRGSADDKPVDVDGLLWICMAHWDRVAKEVKVRTSGHFYPCMFRYDQ